jgi:hypothetical protein
MNDDAQVPTTGPTNGSGRRTHQARRPVTVGSLLALLALSLASGLLVLPQAQAGPRTATATRPSATADPARGASARVAGAPAARTTRTLPSLTRRDLGRTLMGKTVYNPTTDWDVAVGRDDRFYGRLDTVRVFYPGFPKDWPGPAGRIHRPVPLSFRIDPSAVLSGRYDAALRRWFNRAPTKYRIWWTYIHEPEDDITAGRFTAAAYRAAWRHIYAISRTAGNPKLRPTLTLMCWTLSKNSGRRFSDYYPGNFIKTFAWDCYNQSWQQGVYKRPADMFGQAARFSHRRGKGFAIAEFGSRLLPGDDGSRRAAWMVRFAKAAAARDAQYVSYFDTLVGGGDFRLRDAPSRRAWRLVVRKS